MKKNHFVEKETWLSNSLGTMGSFLGGIWSRQACEALRDAGVCTFLGGGCDRPSGCLWLAGMLCIHTPEQKEVSGDRAGIPTVPPQALTRGGKKCLSFLILFLKQI